MSESISKATRKILENHPVIQDCLQQDIINYSALSRKLYRRVSRRVGREVSLDAIKVALIRFAEDIKRSREILEDRIREIIAESTLELKEDIAILTVKQPLFERVSEVASRCGSRFFQLTQGVETFTIAFDERYYSKAVDLIGQTNIIHSVKGQSAIILVSPEDIIYVPGVIAYMTNTLARNNINITQIISCYRDTIFIVDRDRALRAYNLLKSLIAESRS